MEYQRQFIEQAVSMAASSVQRERSEDAKFKFTCEGFWAVELFLSQATPQQVKDFKQALEQGYLELTAFYAHFNELLNEENSRIMLSFASEYAKSIDYKLNTALACDINGFSWGMADFLYDAGVRYLATQINTHHGGYPFDRPFVPFYWETPSGNRILVWSGITYHKANLLGLVPGLNYDGDVGVPGIDIGGSGQFIDVRDLTLAEAKLFPLLEGLEKSGYSHDFLLLAGSGLYTDNSPPTDRICEHIQKWNEKHGDIVRIRTATLSDYFSHLESRLEEIPIYKGDWNDWWSDGVASSPWETRIFREAQRTTRMLRTLDPHSNIIPNQDMRQIEKNLIAFAEHTWGYAYSVPLPWHCNSYRNFTGKARYAIEADNQAQNALFKLMSSKGQGSFQVERPLSYKLINPIDDKVKTKVCIQADYWEEPLLKSGIMLVDEFGRRYPFQIRLQARNYEIEFVAELDGLEERVLHLVPDPNAASRIDERPEIGDSFENDLYRLHWKMGTGIDSLIDKKTGVELLGASDYSLFAPVYQKFTVPAGDSQLAFRSRAGITKVKPEFEVHAGRLRGVTVAESGEVYTKLVFDFEVKGASFYRAEVTFYRELPFLDVHLVLHKEDVWDPEGMYAAFPLQTDGGMWYLDKAGKEIVPGRDQLPYTCCDYYMVQEGAVLCGGQTGVSISMPDVPLLQIGGLKLWDYSKSIEPEGTLFSWLTNNKWETNFKASCGGFYEFRYRIEAGPELANAGEALRRCRNHNYPFVSLRL